MESLHNIQHIETRNILRGLLASKHESEVSRILNHFRKECPVSEIYDATRLLLSMPLFAKYEIPNNFPDELDSIFNFRRLDDIPVDKEIRFQIARLNCNSKKLIDCLKEISAINSFLASSKFEAAIAKIKDFTKSFGLSHLIIKKIAYIQSRPNQSEDVIKDILDFLDSSGSSIYNKQYVHLYEIFGEEAYFSGVLTNWNSELIEAGDDWWPRLYLSNLWPFCSSEEELAHMCLTNGFISLIDCLIFLYSHYETGRLNLKGLESEPFEKFIAPELLEALNEHFPKDLIPKEFVEDTSWSDQKFYRLSLAFIELPKIAVWRASMDRCFRTRLSSGNDITPPLSQSQNLKSIFKSDLKLRYLCAEPNDKAKFTEQFDNKYAGIYERTAALIYCLEMGQSLLDLEQNEIRILLGNTTWLAFFLSEKELQNLYDHSIEYNQLVVSFLSLCMLFERKPSADLEFSVRIEFQIAVQEWFHGDLIEFLNWLHKRTPNLSEVVVYICDVGFLERLYLLIDNFDQVLDARAEICEWIGNNLDRPEFFRQAERLRVDKKLRKIKEHFDDTRIFIDEVRFRLWAEERLQHDMRRIAASGFSKLVSQLPNVDTSKDSPNLLFKDSISGSSLWMLYLCQNSFSEFCTNPVYGIASYLSRRIRHGTLNGFLVSPIDHFLKAYVCPQEIDQEWFSSARDKWLCEYQARVSSFRDDLLFFRSDAHPHGWFSSNILSSPERIQIFDNFQRNMARNIEAGASASDVTLEMIAYCWNCLQDDLLNLQRHISFKEIAELKASIAEHFLQKEKSSLLVSFRQDLDALVTNRWSEFVGWFERPDSVSITVTHREIAETILEEIRPVHTSFRPKLEYEGDVDGKLFGDTYHIIYDCLFVLYCNAAENGKKDGILKLSVKLSDVDKCRVLWLAVRSTCPDEASKNRAITRIAEALQNGDIETAMTTEGFTGLRKLKRLVNEEWKLRVPELDGLEKFVDYDSGSNWIELRFGLPIVTI